MFCMFSFDGNGRSSHSSTRQFARPKGLAYTACTPCSRPPRRCRPRRRRFPTGTRGRIFCGGLTPQWRTCACTWPTIRPRLGRIGGAPCSGSQYPRRLAFRRARRHSANLASRNRDGRLPGRGRLSGPPRSPAHPQSRPLRARTRPVHQRALSRTTWLSASGRRKPNRAPARTPGA